MQIAVVFGLPTVKPTTDQTPQRSTKKKKNTQKHKTAPNQLKPKTDNPSKPSPAPKTNLYEQRPIAYTQSHKVLF